MASFFVRTEDSVAGPFTGIELREAAMAGILRFEAIIGGGPDGPWFRAADIGLFSEKRTALPHPPGTQIATYQTRGLKGGDEGTYKLRELIGFAARGLLPADSQVQSDLSPGWFPVTRLPILNACLRGELVLLDERGGLLVRTNLQSKLDAERRNLSKLDAVEHPPTNGLGSPAAPEPPVRTGLAPGEVAGSAQMTSSSSPVPPPIYDAAEAAAAEAEAEQDREKRLEEYEQLERERAKRASRVGISNRLRRFYQGLRVPLVGKRSVVPWRKVGIALAGLLMLGGVGALAVMALKTEPTTRSDVLGNWIRDTTPASDQGSGNTGSGNTGSGNTGSGNTGSGNTGSGNTGSGNPGAVEQFVVAFRPNGQFVLASADVPRDSTEQEPSEGTVADVDQAVTNSWNGNFSVEPAAKYSRPLASTKGHSEVIDLVSQQHLGDNVYPTDGHVFLEGFLTQPPQITGHSLTDFYVRVDGEDLLLGYPSELRWRQDETTLRAGWIRLKRMDLSPQLNVADELRLLKPTENLERTPYGGQIEVPHVSEAVVIARTGVEDEKEGEKTLRHSCMVYSEEIDLWSMLARFGAPDEVRAIYDFELTSTFAELPNETLKGGRLLRYADLTFAFSSNGVLRYVVAAESSATRR